MVVTALFNLHLYNNPSSCAAAAWGRGPVGGKRCGDSAVSHISNKTRQLKTPAPQAHTCALCCYQPVVPTRKPPVPTHLLPVTGSRRRCLALRRLPADEPQVSWLLQLMELAVSARSCLRERAFAMPPVPVVKIKHTAEVQVRFRAQGLGFRF